jgi:hypothetical protein
MTAPEDDEDVIASEGWALFTRRDRPDRDESALVRRLRATGTGWARRWLALAPRRRRLIMVATVAVLVIAAGTAVTLGRPSAPAPVVAVKPPAPVSPPRPVTTLPGSQSSYDPDADTSSPLGPPLTVPGGAVRDVGVEADDLYVVSATAFSVVHSYDRRLITTAAVASPEGARVVLDESSGTAWIVPIGAAGQSIREFTFTDLRATRSVPVPGVVYDALVAGGQLYLATSGGVFLLARGASALTAVTNSVPPVQALSADPDSGTVLALTSGPAARIITITNGGNTVEAGPVIDVSSPTIAVIKDTLWVGAVGPNGRLERFDPSTLRPLPEAAGGVVVAEGLDTGVQLVSGTAALWDYPVVIPADLWVLAKASKQLYCIDSQSGRVLQRWDNITHPVSSGGSGPYVVTAQGVQPLVLRGNCDG